MEIRRVALFVSKETRNLEWQFALHHCPDEGSAVVLILSDEPDSAATEYAEQFGVPSVVFDHKNPRIGSWLMETVSFYDIDSIVVEPEYHHLLPIMVRQVVHGSVFLIEATVLAA